MDSAPHILITTGPTREFIDDVRFLSNRSTGRMGIEIARSALAEGWRVTLVCGPISLEPPDGVDVVQVVSAEDMLIAVQDRITDVNVFVGAAAVGDYRPIDRMAGKLKKQPGTLTLELERTPDTLAWVGWHKREGLTIVGFALEATADRDAAREKLVRKGCNLVVLNTTANFDKGGGEVAILDSDGVQYEGTSDKPELARQIVGVITAIRGVS